jgi:hypothetical protein
MEPTTVISTAIIAALSAGVTGGVTAVGKQAILDSYEALKRQSNPNSVSKAAAPRPSKSLNTTRTKKVTN